MLATANRDALVLRVEQLQILNLPKLSFSVADGECMAVEGPSGSGKTTLLRAIADLDRADGVVFADGAERNEMPASQWRKLVRYVPSEPGWWADTPRETFPRTLDEKIDNATRLLHSVGLDHQHLDRPITKLSTGERQRLAFVRALLDEPRILLLDEPTSSLDPGNNALVEELIRHIKLSHLSLLLVSHDAAQVDRLADTRLQLAAPEPSNPIPPPNHLPIGG